MTLSNDTTHKTVTRRKGERIDAFQERKRAERHRMHMEDMALCQKIERHSVLTVAAAVDAIFRGQE